ncbi:MAG: hypothetical protein ACE5JI_10385, partial [Acidobacteriota bacterium]
VDFACFRRQHYSGVQQSFLMLNLAFRRGHDRSCMDGDEVVLLEDVVEKADIFITATGNYNIIAPGSAHCRPGRKELSSKHAAAISTYRGPGDHLRR